MTTDSEGIVATDAGYSTVSKSSKATGARDGTSRRRARECSRGKALSKCVERSVIDIENATQTHQQTDADDAMSEQGSRKRRVGTMQANAIYINDAYQPTANKDTKVVTNVATDVQMGMTKELWAKLIAGICLFAAPIAVLVGTFAL